MIVSPDFSIATIVEGHGEVHAVPVLLRRICLAVRPDLNVHIFRPIRRTRDRLLIEGELEKDVQLAGERLGGVGAVLILIDSEGDCPAHLGTEIRSRAERARPDRTIKVALAHSEYEAWFLASALSLRGKRGLSDNLRPPANPELITGAKEWLRSNMIGSRTYSETVDQPAFSALMDLDEAKTSPSFERLFRVVSELLQIPIYN